MTTVLVVTSAGLGLSALLVLVRVLRGPDLLDRLVALDVLMVLLVSILVVRAAAAQDTTAVVLVLVVGLVGFLSSLAAVRLLPEEPTAQDRPGEGAER